MALTNANCLAQGANVTEKHRSELGDEIAGEELLRRLGEGSNDALFLLDVRENQLLYISKGYERIWGKSCESLFRDPSSWRDSIHPEDRCWVTEIVDRSYLSGSRFEIEFRIVRPDGSVRQILDRCVPMIDSDGAVSRVVGHAEDITERRSRTSLPIAKGCLPTRRDMPAGAIIVVVADGRAAMRAGLAGMIARHHAIQVSNLVHSAQDLVNVCRRERPDVILSSFELSGLTGPDLVHAVLDVHKEARVALIADRPREGDMVTCLRAGAAAYLPATAAEGEVVECIQTLHAGRRYVSGQLASVLVNRLDVENLTGREREILQLIAQGNSNKRIARELAIAETTVKSHVKHIMEKLSASNRAEAAAIASQRGLLGVER